MSNTDNLEVISIISNPQRCFNEALEDSPSKRKYSYEIPICSICLNDMLSDLIVTSCGHVYHSECLINCLKNKSVCPNCRTFAPLESTRHLQYSINKSTILDQD